MPMNWAFVLPLPLCRHLGNRDLKLPGTNPSATEGAGLLA